MDSKHLHVALASDQNYAEYVAVVIVSLFDNNKWQDFTTVHLLSNGIDEATIDKLKQHIPANAGELKVYDIRTLKEDLGVNVPPTFAITTYARLFLPHLLDKEIDRVLYVDCDVVISGSVQEFFNVSFEGQWIAGVRDTLISTVFKVAVGMAETDEYFNAGVLMMNLDAWRENNVTQRCLDFLLEHNGRVVHHDQGIINGVCNHKKVVMHPKFNASTCYFSHPYSLLKKQNNPFYSQQEVEEATSNPAIIHFTEGFYNRPWIVNSLHPLRDLFRRYHSMTQWADTPLQPDRRSAAARLVAWSFIHLPYWMYRFVAKTLAILSRLKR